MTTKSGTTKYLAAQATAKPGLKTLVDQVADYVAASDDPRATAAAIMAELVQEAIAIEVDAIRALDRREARQGRKIEPKVSG